MIIIILGLPGSGKSYFSLRLADMVGAKYINSDRIRIAMNAKGKYSFADKFAVYEEMARCTKQIIELGKDVVVDGTFYHQRMRELFIALAMFYHSPIHFIEITTSEEITKERLSKHRKESEANYKVYKRIKKQFYQLDLPHLTLQSGRDNIDDMTSEALKYIGLQR